jgi:hypothetical protein
MFKCYKTRFEGHAADVVTKRIHTICWWENRMRKDHLGYLGLKGKGR